LDQLRRVVVAEIIVIGRREVPRLVRILALPADLDEAVLLEEALQPLANLPFADPAFAPEGERVVARLGPPEASLVAVREVHRVVAEVASIEQASVGLPHLLHAI